MLFVADPKKAGQRDVYFIHIIPTIIVLLVMLGATGWTWFSILNRENAEKNVRIKQETININTDITERMEIYHQVLVASNGLFLASENVTREEWRAFYKNFDLQNKYPGLEGVSYIERVPIDQLQNHLNKIRSEGFPDYSVAPLLNDAIVTPTVFPSIQEVTVENYKNTTLGFNGYSEKNRQVAIDTATTQKKAVLTGKLQLLTSKIKQPAFIMFYPIYLSNKQKYPIGFAGAPLNAKDFFEGIFSKGGAKAPLAFKIYDMNRSPGNVLYQTDNFANSQSRYQPRFDEINLYERKWAIEYKVPNNFKFSTSNQNSNGTLIGGIILSFLTAGLVLSLLVTRTRSLQVAENDALQQAKDDLLSIASHQLRTPATGVKQYIGMLREGYAGKITRSQKRLIDAAYDSNERQLGTIDEILQVARIDSGNIRLDKERINVNNLVERLLLEHSSKINEKSLEIIRKYPKDTLIIQGDRDYIRMAIDNIISNAIKYSHDNGTITVKLSKKHLHAIISIADTGVGIHKKDKDKLFVRFSRIHNELTRKTTGSGIGLYVAKKIVDLHKGVITVVSAPNKGSTFTILLPTKRDKPM